jgi:hypothetical protein
MHQLDVEFTDKKVSPWGGGQAGLNDHSAPTIITAL